jgi:hypothetical protein
MISPVSMGNRLCRIGVAGVLMGCLTAFVPGAGAQSASQVRPTDPALAAPPAMRFAATRGQTRFDAANVNLYKAPAVPQYRAELSKPLGDSSDAASWWEPMVEFSGTPFTQQVRVPLGSLFKGRIRLGGFNAVTPMENIQRGLPGGGGLDAWSDESMGHGGMVLPKDDNQYGLCLAIRLRRGMEEETGEGKRGLVSRIAEFNVWLHAI